MEPLDFPQLKVDYITPCEHRKGFDPAKPENAHICMLATQLIGYSHSVHAMVCANCRIDGEPNRALIGKFSLDALMAHLNLAYLGFHHAKHLTKEEAEANIVALFERACTLAGNDMGMLEAIGKQLQNCVSKGRVGYEDAVKLAEKYLANVEAKA